MSSWIAPRIDRKRKSGLNGESHDFKLGSDSVPLLVFEFDAEAIDCGTLFSIEQLKLRRSKGGSSGELTGLAYYVCIQARKLVK